MASVIPYQKNGKIISFKFRVYVGKDSDGKQIFKFKTWKPEKHLPASRLLPKAKKEAALWEQQILCEMGSTQPAFEPCEITLSKFTYDVWFPSQMSEKDHRDSTIAFHGYLLINILEKLGDCSLSSITPKDIEKYISYLRNGHKTKQNKPLSPKTIRHYYSTLNLIFEYATKIEYIQSNPIAKVDTPKLVRHKVNALSNSEVKTFVSELAKLPLKQRLMYTLILTTGVRRGEFFGLQWRDIDLQNQILHVKRNVTYTSKSGTVVGLPKTDTSIRAIPLTDSVVELLKMYKSDRERTDTMYLFPSDDDDYKPHNPSYLTSHMSKTNF